MTNFRTAAEIILSLSTIPAVAQTTSEQQFSETMIGNLSLQNLMPVSYNTASLKTFSNLGTSDKLLRIDFPQGKSYGDFSDATWQGNLESIRRGLHSRVPATNPNATITGDVTIYTNDPGVKYRELHITCVYSPIRMSCKATP